MTKITKVLAAVLVGGIGLAVLSGCTPARQATVMEMPALTWQGAEPASAFEAEPAVQFLREYNLAIAVAWNTGDFTFDQLTTTADVDVVNTIADQYAGQGNTPYIYRGPAAIEPIAVETEGTNRIAVTTCEADESIYITDSKPFADIRKVRITEVTYHLRLTDAGTFQKDNSISAEASEEYPACLAVDIPVALFSTPPTMPDTPVTAPVREPLQNGDE